MFTKAIRWLALWGKSKVCTDIPEFCQRSRPITDSLVGFQEGSDYGGQARRGTLAWDLLFRKKSLRKLLIDLEEAGLEEGDVLVRDLLDGGETVYYRLYDEDGTYVKHLY